LEPYYIIEILPALVANALPVLFGGGPALDGGLKFNDGRPVLGSHKTIRGAIVGIVGGAVMGLILSLWRPKFAAQGLLMGVGAMVGDALGSFIKRRLGIAEGKWTPLVDELPFFYAALLFASPLLPAGIFEPLNLVALSVLVIVLHEGTNYLVGRLR